MVRGNSHGLSTLLKIPSCSLACPELETRWARNHDFIRLPSLLGRFETSQSSHSQGTKDYQVTPSRRLAPILHGTTMTKVLGSGARFAVGAAVPKR